jgi:transcriptional regulator with XRE-family HTH domain
MSMSTEGAFIPEWDLADRLAKALRACGLSAHEMADYLGVHRNTVSAWMNGRTPPSIQSVRLWALRTGVPFEWLLDGTMKSPPSPPPPGGQVRDKKRKPPTRKRPADEGDQPSGEYEQAA